MNKKELWSRLKHYHFKHIVPANFWDMVKQTFGGENASAKAFASKIARKHGWQQAFAMKAVFEYKKFVYLGVISDFTVSPSKIIDVVWHEHLLFTEAYREFCKKVIEHEFDHFPELIPNILQTKKFRKQYIQTLQLYVSEFNIEPPESVWGNTKFDKSKLNGKPDQNALSQTVIYNDDLQPLYHYYEQDAVNPVYFPEFNDSEGFDGGGASGSWDSDDAGSDSDGGSDGDGGGCSGGCGGGCGGD